MGCGGSTTASKTNKPNENKGKKDEEESGTVLYIYPGSAPCRAALFVVEGANIPAEVKIVDLMKGEQMEEWFLKINPAHTVPALVDGKEKMGESRIIMTYLMDKYASENKLYPSKENAEERQRVDKMLAFDESDVYKNVSGYVYPIVLKGEPADPAKESVLKGTLTELDKTLGEQPYSAGSNLTIADYSICANMSLLELVDYDFSQWLNVVEWQKKMVDLPYYEKVQKGLVAWKEMIKKGKEE